MYWLQVQEGIGPIAIRGSRAPRQGRRVAFLRRGARSKGCFVSCIRENGRAESRWESRESKFPRTATGIFTWASIQARSIARVLWLKGKGRGEREGEKTKFSMALTSGTRGEILILIWWRKRTIFVGFLVMG